MVADARPDVLRGLKALRSTLWVARQTVEAARADRAKALAGDLSKFAEGELQMLQTLIALPVECLTLLRPFAFDGRPPCAGCSGDVKDAAYSSYSDDSEDSEEDDEGMPDFAPGPVVDASASAATPEEPAAN